MNTNTTLTAKFLSLVAAIGGFALLVADTAVAQTQRSGSDSTRIVQQLQQVTAEKNKLQQETDGLKKELEELKIKHAQASTEQSKLQQKARELEVISSRQRAGSGDSEEALQKSRVQMQELITKFRETTQTLKDVETERDTARADQVAKQRELSACVDKNAQMYLLSDELLGKLGNQGVWSAMKGKEPFIKLSRTRLENLVDEYRYRIDELKLAAKSASTISSSAK